MQSTFSRNCKNLWICSCVLILFFMNSMHFATKQNFKPSKRACQFFKRKLWHHQWMALQLPQNFFNGVCCVLLRNSSIMLVTWKSSLITSKYIYTDWLSRLVLWQISLLTLLRNAIKSYIHGEKMQKLISIICLKNNAPDSMQLECNCIALSVA